MSEIIGYAFRTTVHDTKDGKASVGVAYVLEGGKWKQLCETRKMRAYPRTVRARDAAIAICHRFAKVRKTYVSTILHD